MYDDDRLADRRRRHGESVCFHESPQEKATVGVRRRLVYAAGFRLARYTYKEVARLEDARTLRPFTLFLIRREEHENQKFALRPEPAYCA